jgi:predicted DNA-binding transcriptional regulator YafY
LRYEPQTGKPVAEHLKFERYCWFDRQVREGRYPNATSLAHHFEICNKTAQRTIEFMRDRLGSPLEYDPHHKGYYYTDHSFTLPSCQVTQNELLAILLARNLLAESAGGFISRSIQSFGHKLFAATGEFGLDGHSIDTAFSAIWHSYTPAEGETFRLVAKSLIESRQLSFQYFSPSKNEITIRHVRPAHLQHYMGSWVLLACCIERSDWRQFYLGRMSEVHLTDATFPPMPASDWQNHLHGAFGIFQGGEPQEVVLQFNPYRARWLRHEIWHPDQLMEQQPDGSLILRFVVTDFREVKLRILQYGADVEVIAPEELRDEIRGEIGRMVELYAGG